ncbi:MAG TPA: glycosyltransferase family 4 protein [Chitinophagaceae bacterium]|nr:glycosyltransferase family 4 protein [Chitinophagaceae bacterium]
MKKILFVIDTLQFGGSEQSLLENVKRLKHLQPVVCHLYCGDTLKPKFIENGIRVHSFNIRKKYGFAEAFRQLNKLVQKEKPDLLVAYLTRSEIVTRIVGRNNKIPVIGTFVNDLYAKTYNQHLPWFSKKVVYFFKCLNKLTSRYCTGFIANSGAVKEANAKHLNIPLHKIEVIHRGRNSNNFERKYFDEHPADTIRFLNVARLFPVKGHKDLILGFRDFAQNNSGVSLHIAGDGPLYGELTDLIKEHKLEDKVFLLGSRGDVATLLKEFDCFVFPSLVEGFSGAVVEAMFAGLPVLASDIPQNKEAITHLQTGYLFRKESAQEIQKAMSWYKDNRPYANELAGKAYEYARENFELEKIVHKFETYLDSSINQAN